MATHSTSSSILVDTTEAIGDGYELRAFSADDTDRTAEWLQATALGFHDAERAEDAIARIMSDYIQDDRVLTGVYRRDSPTGSWSAERPVGTLSTFVKNVNVGGGSSLPAALIADVSVRATHQRRGLLRAMMGPNLRRAAAAGVPLAALNASEATIYGRFGFAPATYTRRAVVDTGERFQLRTPAAGSVEVTTTQALVDIAPRVFDAFNQHILGSVERSAAYPSRVTGLWAENDRRVRAALHYSSSGSIDGYVTYVAPAWEDDPTREVAVLDLVTATPDAYFGLWEYLASISLTRTVAISNASVADPLPWAMADPRGYRVTGEDDSLWLRILDPVTALESRPYTSDGTVNLVLSDPLDIASGHFTLTVTDGTGRVTTSSAPEAASSAVTMDVSALGAIYLGGTRASVLVDAARISGASTSIEVLDRLLSHPVAPYSITRF
jgi:predicted acetyltransferase